METKHLTTKDGSRITAIHGVAHSTYQGVADWYFVGDIQYESGTAFNREIAPWNLCTEGDEGRAEADTILKAMNEHLRTKGKWHGPKHTKDGRVIRWTPKQKTGLSPIE